VAGRGGAGEEEKEKEMEEAVEEEEEESARSMRTIKQGRHSSLRAARQMKPRRNVRDVSREPLRQTDRDRQTDRQRERDRQRDRSVPE